MDKTRIVVLTILALILALGVCAPVVRAASAPSASAFSVTPVYGIDWTPKAFASGELDYTLTLKSGAFLLFGGDQYQITQVWGFYAVNKTGEPANNFAAKGADSGDWDWGQKSSGDAASVAGWTDSAKKQALLTPVSGEVSRAFRFQELSYSKTDPLAGLHVSVYVPQGKPSPFGSGDTGLVIPDPVPEPGAIAGLVSGLIGLIGCAARRKR